MADSNLDPDTVITTSVTVADALKATVSNFFEETVSAGRSATCVNNISFKNITGCNIGGELSQTCEAQASGTVVANESEMREMQQVVLQNTYEAMVNNTKAYMDAVRDEAKVSGDQTVASAIERAKEYDKFKFNHSILVQNMGQVALGAATIVKTKCTRGASGINTMDLENVTCTGMSEINFAAQGVSAKAIGDCVVNPTREQYAQYLASAAAQESFMAEEFTIKGSALFAVTASIVVSLFLVLLIALWARYARFDRRIAVLVYTLLAFLAVATAVWWPGYYSWRVGVWPWPIPISQKLDGNGQPFCDSTTGQIAASGKALNTVGMWQGDCPDGGNNCGHYPTCGLFSGCDDPEYVNTDKPALDAAIEACSRAPVNGSGDCDLTKLFKSVHGTEYANCTACPEIGVYVRDGELCDAGNVDLLKYGGFGEILGEDGAVKLNTCPTGDDDCIMTELSYGIASPSECLSASYHLRKKILVSYLRACTAVENTTAHPGKPLTEQCPPKFNDHLKCDATGVCDYTAVNAVNAARCKNDYEDCQDPAYIADKETDALLTYKCSEAVQRWEEMNKLPLYFTIASYSIVVIAVAGLVWWSKRHPAQSLKTAIESVQKKKKMPLWGFTAGFLLILTGCIITGPPFGMVGASFGMAPLYDSGTSPFGTENYDANGPLAIGVFSVFLVSLVVWSLYYYVATRPALVN